MVSKDQSHKYIHCMGLFICKPSNLRQIYAHTWFLDHTILHYDAAVMPSGALKCLLGGAHIAYYRSFFA